MFGANNVKSITHGPKKQNPSDLGRRGFAGEWELDISFIWLSYLAMAPRVSLPTKPVVGMPFAFW